MSIVTRANKPEFNKSEDKRYPRNKIIFNWKGKVYCASVTNHTLLVRRFGKAVWCGNSVFEHAQLNFVATNVSRIYTHEQVRHRSGTAYSQSSGRYIRSDVLNVVIDPILEPANDLVEEARAYLENWYARLGQRLNIDQEKSFARKKKLTSAMRRMLPNGQANELGFSLNLRSLRHIIEMRTNEHAEWEIREIYSQVYNLVKDKFPAMFADAKVEIIDGLPQITFDNGRI